MDKKSATIRALKFCYYMVALPSRMNTWNALKRFFRRKVLNYSNTTNSVLSMATNLLILRFGRG